MSDHRVLALVVFGCLCGAMIRSAPAADPAEAVDAGRAVGAAWKGENQGAASDYLAGALGDTRALEALRDGGRAKLYAPGRAEADRCADETDPVCRAVQVVDRGAAGPGVNPDPGGGVTAGYDDVVSRPEDFVEVGAGNGAADCRPNYVQVKPLSRTETCDVRVADSSRETTCREEVHEFYSTASRWSCRLEAARRETENCRLPVLVPQRHVYTVRCREGERPASLHVCPVTTSSRSAWLGRCERPLKKKTLKTCTRRLLVKPAGTCRPGDVVSARVSDPGFLGEDAVPGADVLEVAYRCDPTTPFPVVELRTNGSTGGAVDRGWRTSEALFDFRAAHPGGELRFEGSLQCDEGNVCTTDVRMTVFRGSGSNLVRQGDLTKRLVFTRFATLSEAEWWEEDCTEDGK